MAYRLSSYWKEKAHEESIWAITFEKTEGKIITGDSVGNIKIWQIGKDEEIKEERKEKAHILGITQIDIINENDDDEEEDKEKEEKEEKEEKTIKFYTAAMDGTIKIHTYNTEKKEITKQKIIKLNIGTNFVVKQRKGKIAAAGKEGIIKIIDLKTGNELNTIYTDNNTKNNNKAEEDNNNNNNNNNKAEQTKEKISTITAATYHPTPKIERYAIGYHTGEIGIYETKEYKKIKTIDGITGNAIRDMVYQDEYLFTVSDDGYIRIYTEEKNMVEAQKVDTSIISLAVLKVNYTEEIEQQQKTEKREAIERTFYIATGQSNGSVKIWQYTARTKLECIHTYIEHKKQVWKLKYETEEYTQPLDPTTTTKTTKTKKTITNNYIHLFSVSSDGNMRAYLCPLDQSK